MMGYPRSRSAVASKNCCPPHSNVATSSPRSARGRFTSMAQIGFVSGADWIYEEKKLDLHNCKSNKQMARRRSDFRAAADPTCAFRRSDLRFLRIRFLVFWQNGKWLCKLDS